MAKLRNDTNQVESPVDIAMQMLAGTQDIIFNSILGPQQPQRVDKIAGEVIDFDTIIQDTIVQGKLMQEENQVSAPTRPNPVPPPSPSGPPEMPATIPTTMPQQSINQVNNNGI